MIYFIYGEDTYRAKQKLNEIVESYKKVHKSGLNLTVFDADEKDFKDLLAVFKITSMFSEKKLVVLKNLFLAKAWQEDFLENIKSLNELKDIIVVYETEKVDQRNKLFKNLLKTAKCQEFSVLTPGALQKWVQMQFEKYNSQIEPYAANMLCVNVGSNLWQMENEIKKLAHFRKDSVVKREDVALLIRPKIENDIFKTIDALAQKNKSQALDLLEKHLQNGDNALYLLSMVSYQFRNLLAVKDLLEKGTPYYAVAKKSGLHPFVAQKSCQLCSHFTMPELKKIYQKIYLADSNIKSGKADAQTALQMLVSEI